MTKASLCSKSEQVVLKPRMTDSHPFTQIQGHKLATKLCVQLVTIFDEEKANLSGTFNNHLSN